jgi:predicted O-methyltransferase YrrM
MKSAVHACKVLLRIESPESQVSDDEMACLLSYANNAEVIVEIGCYEGKTTAMLAGQTTGKVYSIDPFFKGRVGVCYGELIAKTQCRRQGLDNIEFIKAFSYEAAPGFGEPIDLLFIDADHRYEAVKRDWEDWFPKVRNGGVVALHDSRPAPNSPERLGSMKFYEEYIPTVSNVQEVDAVGSLVVLRVTK